jgi:hypothetical protein
MSRKLYIVAVVLCLHSAVVCAADEQIRFEGRYEYRTDKESQEILGKQVCFFPTSPTSALVPRPTGDHRLPWFCFSNSVYAANMFGFELSMDSNTCGIQGNADISVTGYKRYTGEGDDNDIATLKAVLRKSQPEVLLCSNQ